MRSMATATDTGAMIRDNLSYPSIGSELVRWILIAFLLLSSALGASANTLVIILRTEEANIVAANSQESMWDNLPTGIICKIHITNNFVWTNIGIHNETAGPFDIWKIAESAANQGGSLDDVATRFARDTVPQLGEVLSRLKSSQPERYSVLVTKGDHSVGAVIFFQGATFRGETFKVPDPTDPTNIINTSATCPGRCRKTDQLLFFSFGHNEAVNAALQNSPTIWNDRGIAGTINYLMDAQHSATPNAVGPPVSILRIDKSGALNWLQKGACN